MSSNNKSMYNNTINLSMQDLELIFMQNKTLFKLNELRKMLLAFKLLEPTLNITDPMFKAWVTTG